MRKPVVQQNAYFSSGKAIFEVLAALGSGLEASWDPLRSSLVALWGLLGPLRSLLKVLGAILAALGAVLDRSWELLGSLGAILGALGSETLVL